MIIIIIMILMWVLLLRPCRKKMTLWLRLFFVAESGNDLACFYHGELLAAFHVSNVSSSLNGILTSIVETCTCDCAFDGSASTPTTSSSALVVWLIRKLNKQCYVAHIGCCGVGNGVRGDNRVP
jgi:hypothetical protein